MADLTFYMKPGCKTNTRQLAALQAAGFSVSVKDLLAEPWTAEKLRSFFGNKAVTAWINPFAPSVKSGDVDIESFSDKSAIQAMIDDPYLIRRPLIETDQGQMSGFETAELLRLGIDLSGVEKVSSACSSPDTPCPEAAGAGG